MMSVLDPIGPRVRLIEERADRQQETISEQSYELDKMKQGIKKLMERVRRNEEELRALKRKGG